MSEQPPPAPRPQGRRRWPWIILAVVVLLGLGFRVALPSALEWGVGWGAKRFLGLAARVDNIDLELLRGRVSVEGLVVGQPDDMAAPQDVSVEQALLNLDRAYADLHLRSLLDRRVHLTEVSLSAPRVRVEQQPDKTLVLPRPPQRGQEEPEEESDGESKPWGVRVDQLALSDVGVEMVDRSDGGTPVDLKLAGLQLSEVAFEDGEFTLGGLQLQRPTLSAERELLFDPPRIAPGPDEGAKRSADDEKPDGGPPPYRIAAIHIDRAEFTLVTQQGPLDIAVTLDARDIAAEPGVLFPVRLDLEVEQGTATYDGKLGLLPIAWNGQLRWNQLPVPPFTLINAPQIVPWLQSCSSSGDARVVGTLGSPAGGGEPAQVRTSGSTQVNSVVFADPENGDVAVELEQFEVVVREAVRMLKADEAGAVTPTRIDLESVRVVKPKLLFRRPAPALDQLLASLGGDEAAPPETAEPDDSENATAKAAEGEAPKAAATEAGTETVAEQPAAAGEPDVAPPIDVTLDRLELVEGDLEYGDRSLDPPFDTTVKDLTVTIQGVRWPEMDLGSLEAKGIVDETSPFTFTASVDDGRGKGTFEIDRLALEPFNSFSQPAGYKLKRGEVSVETDIELEPGRYELVNGIVLKRLAIDGDDGGAFAAHFGMPLDVALALLRDPAGNISLELPMAFTDSGMETSITAVLDDALRQALIGAASSPLKLAGAALTLVAGKEADLSLDPIASQPGSVELAPESAKRLEGIGKLLDERPGLGLVLEGRVGPEDRSPVAEQILAERIEADADLPDVSAGFFQKRRITGALEARSRGESVELDPEDQAVLRQLVEAQEVPPERLEQLALERATRARELLVEKEGIDASRVEVASHPEEGEPGVVLRLKAQ